MARIKPEFDKRGVKIIGISVDPVEDHHRWIKDIEETQGTAPNYPMIGDTELKVAKLYDMLPAGAGDSSAGRTPADNATVRNVFVIGPDKKVKLVLVYPMSTGRNFDEVLRVIDSMQLTAKHSVATPVNWNNGRRRDRPQLDPDRRGQEALRQGCDRDQALPADHARPECLRPVRCVHCRCPEASRSRCSARAPGAWARSRAGRAAEVARPAARPRPRHDA